MTNGYIKDTDTAEKIAYAVSQRGGRAYYVGGYVRDFILEIPNKDIDIEVHGLAPAVLEEILDSFGERISIGESFGIYNIRGCQIDIAMPRKEKLRGVGHRDFEVFVDPFAGTEKAAMRRDFTVNALMMDVLTREIVDHFGGITDLKNKVLRHVNNETFAEDPLRVLRGAQFAARFEFSPAPETVELCKDMDLSHLPKERVAAELEKALLKAKRPSVFFAELRKMEQLDVWFPELAALIGVEQNPKHHSEGDVWVHTMMTLDEAVKYRDKVKDPFAFMLSAITHDFGKAVTTAVINGEIHSHGHEEKGLPIAEAFVKRITDEVGVLKYVLNLTEYHMKPNTMAAYNSSVKKTNKLFDESADPLGLICIAMSDSRGKTAPREYISYDSFLYERLEIYREYMSRPYVMGRDLIDAGLKPAPYFSDILDYAHKLRLAGIEKESALKQTLSYARKKYKLNI